MKLAVWLIFLSGAIWISHDPRVGRMLGTEFSAAKSGVLAKACPPDNTSTFCHIMVALLY
jgi:hypothetical protein